MLPRLLYVGDVPVEASYHGSALLHRLLANYPPDRLSIIETAVPSLPSRRLPQVNYLSQPLANQRWLNTRFHPQVVAWFSRVATRRGPQISSLLNGFGCESVLTVAHGFGWLAAADLAAKRNVPLHLIVHDDWPRVAKLPSSLRNWLDKRFARVYRQAQSRLCVSPSMQSDYKERYGGPAEVLYPSRAADLPQFVEPPKRLAHNDHQFTIAFAGTINSIGYTRALIDLHHALAAVRGRLLIFGPLTIEQARQTGLDLPHVTIGGLLSWPELMKRLREETDALFVPMSFDAVDQGNMKMAFPSKLADCTAVGVPLLIYGPSYCSAVRWAKENPEVAEFVQSPEDLGKAVRRLANDPERRVELGSEALRLGAKYFAHENVREVFIRALMSA